MKKQLLIILAIYALAYAQHSLAQTSIELTCKAKAKEIALQTYDTCLTEKKQAQIDQIRSEYQEKLNELKKHYDTELKKLGNSKSNSDSEVSSSSSSTQGLNSKESIKDSVKRNLKSAKATLKGDKSNKGIAMSLPAKNSRSTVATKVDRDNRAVVTRGDDESSDGSIRLYDSDGKEVDIVDPSENTYNAYQD